MRWHRLCFCVRSRKKLLLFCRFDTTFVKPFHDLLTFVMHSEGSFSSGKISFGKVTYDPEGGNGQAAFAEKALPLLKMSNNALFLSRLVKGVFYEKIFFGKCSKVD